MKPPCIYSYKCVCVCVGARMPLGVSPLRATHDLCSRLQYVTQRNMATRFKGGGSEGKGCEQTLQQQKKAAISHAKCKNVPQHGRGARPRGAGAGKHAAAPTMATVFIERKSASRRIHRPLPPRKHGMPHDLLHAHPFYGDRPLLAPPSPSSPPAAPPRCGTGPGEPGAQH